MKPGRGRRGNRRAGVGGATGVGRPTALIELDRVSRWFGRHRALHEVTLRLPPGRIGLLGPNGAGKSTLLKILLGLLPPTSGSGRFFGHDLASAGALLRRAIGYMPE